MIRRILAGAAVALVLALALTPLLALAQGLSAEAVVDAACAGDGAGAQLALGILAAIAGASALANLRARLPAWLVALLDAVALNFFKAASPLTGRRQAPGLLLALGLGLGVAACTGDPAKDAATVEGYVVAYQPIASALACTAQAGANIAGDAATRAGDAAGAGVASLFSAANGLFCNGLAAGAKLPQPVTIPLSPASLGAAPAPPG